MTGSEDVSFLKKVIQRWWIADPWTLGAALSYYMLFFLAPFFVFILALVGLFISPQAAEYQLFSDIERVAGDQAVSFLQAIIQQIRGPNGSGIAATISFVTVIVGSLWMFEQIKISLDKIWGKLPEWKGISGVFKQKFFLFALMLVFGILLTAATIVSSLMPFISGYITEWSPRLAHGMNSVTILVPFCLILCMVTALYRYLPHAYVSWGSAIVGALITSILFVLGRFCIVLYLTLFPPESTYQAAGAAVVILIWIYYSAQIFFFGAAWTATLDEKKVTHI